MTDLSNVLILATSDIVHRRRGQAKHHSKNSKTLYHQNTSLLHPPEIPPVFRAVDLLALLRLGSLRGAHTYEMLSSVHFRGSTVCSERLYHGTTLEEVGELRAADSRLLSVLDWRECASRQR